jgi:hypothetical protein
MNRWKVILLGGLFFVLPLFSESMVRIVAVRGEVRVRRSLEETWSPAGAGTMLKPLDTVFSGEASEAVLLLEDGTRFTLGGNAVLDVSDLRRITERQMFLFLMSQKVERLSATDSSSAIRIVNVSVVRGSQKQASTEPAPLSDVRGWTREKNGAKALLDADYCTNAVVKFYKILQRHPDLKDGGEIHWCLGRAFEALKETGRAADAYRTALDRVNDGALKPSEIAERKARIEAALQQLKSSS